MNNEGKMREEFEAWCVVHGYTLRPAETNCGVIIDGQYGNQRVQIAWESWQASRAALCVDLPTCTDGSQYTYFRELVDELETLGVNYK